MLPVLVLPLRKRRKFPVGAGGIQVLGKEEGRIQQKCGWLVECVAHNWREAGVSGGWAEVWHVATQWQVHTPYLGPDTWEMNLDKTSIKFPINCVLLSNWVLDSDIPEDYQPSLENSWCYQNQSSEKWNIVPTKSGEVQLGNVVQW